MPSFEDDLIPTCNTESSDQLIDVAIDIEDDDEDKVPFIIGVKALQHLTELTKYLLNSKIQFCQVYNLKEIVYNAVENNLVQPRIIDNITIEK